MSTREWPKRKPMEWGARIVITVNVIACIVCLLATNWSDAMLGALLAYLFFALSRAEREVDFLNASIRFAATESRFR